MTDIYIKARAFIYRNARPLDIARWQYHFEGGTKEAVLTALDHYQNEDGGFGHALEPDCWNPNSAPIQTWAATEILREIDFTGSAHPIIQSILRYLENTEDFNSQYWYANVKTNMDFPRAEWWGFSDDPKHRCNSYNPTACLAGFIIRFADSHSELYKIGCRIAKEAFDFYFGQGLLDDMFCALCYIRLMEYCEEAGAAGVIDIPSLKKKLREQVENSTTQNTVEWETSYICTPSFFFKTNDSVFYADNKNIADYECEHIIKTQLADGSWNIPWRWEKYPEEWAIAKNWWKASGALANMLYLKGMGRSFNI